MRNQRNVAATCLLFATGLAVLGFAASCGRTDALAQAAPSASSSPREGTSDPLSATSSPVAASSGPAPLDSASVYAADAAADAGAQDAGAGDGASDADAAGEAVCPPGMARVQRFCVDLYEATLVSRDGAGGEVRHAHFERPAQGVTYEARSVAGEYPQGYISRVEAAAACKTAGKRLCTRSEWQRACMGRRGWTYPYGNARRAGRCNNGKVHLLSKMFGTNGRAWKYDEHFNNPLLNQEPGFLARGGEYGECMGEAGTFDQVGNLHEWVSDTVTEEFVERLENDGVERRKQPYREGNGIFMGGFFSTTSEHGPGCKFTTFAHEPTYHDYSIGFRCCQSLPKSAK